MQVQPMQNYQGVYPQENHALIQGPYGYPQQGGVGAPVMTAGQPGMMMGQPGMMVGQPGMMVGQPGMMMAQPGMMGGQPGMMMAQPGMMQPMVMVPANPLNFMGGMDKLMSVPGVFIKQKVELLEVISGCETENNYVVYAATETGDKSKIKLFKAKEKSSCLARNCLSGDCRPFKVKVNHDASGIPSSNDKEPFMKFNRECACTCCCFNRPEMSVNIVEGGHDVYIGKVRYPFTCDCNIDLEIYDSTGKVKYYITTYCCRLGIWCPFPCESCQFVDFDVLDANRNKVSKLEKRSAGCLKSTVSDADNFSLVFPQNSSKEDRALLLASVIMLDFTLFEVNDDNSDN